MKEQVVISDNVDKLSLIYMIHRLKKEWAWMDVYNYNLQSTQLLYTNMPKCTTAKRRQFLDKSMFSLSGHQFVGIPFIAKHQSAKYNVLRQTVLPLRIVIATTAMVLTLLISVMLSTGHHCMPDVK